MYFYSTLNNFVVTDIITSNTAQGEFEPLFEIEMQEEAPYVQKQILHFSSNNQNLINAFKKNCTVYNWIFSFEDFLCFNKFHNLSSGKNNGSFWIKNDIVVISPLETDTLNVDSRSMLEIENYYQKLFVKQDIQLFKYLENIENSYDKNLRKQLRIKLNLIEYLRS